MDGYSGGNSVQQDKVRQVIKEWEVYANVSFVFDNSPDSKAILRIAFLRRTGSWSYLGRDVELPKYSGKATMNLGWIDDTSEEISSSDKGTILHEFGHTLGLLHEHQSPIRGGKLTLREKPVIDFYTNKMHWTEDRVRKNILSVYNKNQVSNYSKVDLKSIMMYFMPDTMNEEKIEIDPNNELSDTDKAYITINYPREHPHENGWTIEHALEVAGVSDADSKTLVGICRASPNGWVELRKRFCELTDKLTYTSSRS